MTIEEIRLSQIKDRFNKEINLRFSRESVGSRMEQKYGLTDDLEFLLDMAERCTRLQDIVDNYIPERCKPYRQVFSTLYD